MTDMTTYANLEKLKRWIIERVPDYGLDATVIEEETLEQIVFYMAEVNKNLNECETDKEKINYLFYTLLVNIVSGAIKFGE